MGLARPRGDRGPVARRLIVTADALGRSAGVDRGIVRAHREGIVTSATLMANTTDAAHAGAVARADPSLDVGVHLVLTFARPLSEPTRVRSLVTPTGEFPRRSLLLTREVDRDEALVEYRAQYARARAPGARGPPGRPDDLRRALMPRSAGLTSRERVRRALRGDAVDRPPFAVWRHFYPDENEGAERLAGTTIAFTTRHRLDIVKYNPRAHYHAEPWGTAYRYAGAARPTMVRYAVRRPG